MSLKEIRETMQKQEQRVPQVGLRSLGGAEMRDLLAKAIHDEKEAIEMYRVLEGKMRSYAKSLGEITREGFNALEEAEFTIIDISNDEKKHYNLLRKIYRSLFPGEAIPE
jgi:rubrerythrin